MSRRSLRPQLNQIRGWVRQGRTDAWIAHQLKVTVQQIQAFKREQGLEPGGEDASGADVEIDLRAETEAAWSEGTLIEATVVVFGWFTRSGKLWAHCVGECVILNSPMTTLVGERMAIRSVTSTQDRQSGTRTTLDE